MLATQQKNIKRFKKICANLELDVWGPAGPSRERQKSRGGDENGGRGGGLVFDVVLPSIGEVPSRSQLRGQE